jgi:hypothetical protein
MSQSIEFDVRDSTLIECRVTFVKDGANLSAFCTCEMGQREQYCAHRLDILRGDTSSIVSDNIADAASIGQWVVGTDVYSAMLEIEQWEHRAAEAERKLEEAKLRLGVAMRD